MNAKFFFTAALSVFLAGPAISADKISFDQNSSIDKFMEKASLNTEVPPPPPAPAFNAAAADKNWTVMVFMNGKNNLAPYSLSDVNEMEAVGSTDKVNVVVQLGLINSGSNKPNPFARPGSPAANSTAVIPAEFIGTRRYLIQKDNDTNKITSPVVADLGKVDMGDYKNVVDFVKWAKVKYPAQHYLLVIWNHGSGWKMLHMDTANKGISYDDETGHHISTPDLGKAFSQFGFIDAYGSDACLMQMASVDWEIKDYVSTIIGSEETEPGDGWDYTGFLTKLTAKPDASPEELGKFSVDSYHDYYAKTGDGTTDSAVRVSALPAFLQLVNGWVDAVMKANAGKAVIKARSSAQAYAYPDNKDLYHFLKLVNSATTDASVKKAGTTLMDYIAKQLVITSRTTGNYKNSYGIAVYLPSSGYDSAYDSLKWAKDSKWDEFIKWIK